MLAYFGVIEHNNYLSVFDKRSYIDSSLKTCGPEIRRGKVSLSCSVSIVNVTLPFSLTDSLSISTSSQLVYSGVVGSSSSELLSEARLAFPPRLLL